MAKSSVPGFVAERFSFGKPASIDREKGIVYGVRVLNPESRNDRVYPEPVMAAHLKLYANLPVNVGHHYDPATMVPREVPPADRFGRLGPNPRIENGGITADYLQFNPKHPFAEAFLWACEHQPDLYSFSPLHRVKWSPKRDAKNRLVAESIMEAASADIVSDGGTTSTIFESWTREAMATPPVAADVAAALETDGAWIAFLTDLFAAAKGLAQPTKDTIMALVTAAMSGAAEPPPEATDGTTDPAAAAPAMESLRRMGKVGRWAAGKLDAIFVAEAAKKRTAWAEGLIKTEGVPESLVTPLFTQMVAESFGNAARAGEIIADRKKLAGTTGGGKAPHTAPAGGAGQSLADIVNGYCTG